MRCSVAFGAVRLCLVGAGRPRVSTHGAFGSHHYLLTRAFSTWAGLRQHAQDGWDCQVVGICLEATPGSLPVHTRPFQGPTLFVTPTKGKTLSEEQRGVCDALVHVPITGGHAAEAAFAPRGPLVLDTDVALSIVLHHFTAWAQCRANAFRGQKYVLGVGAKTGEVEEEERHRLQAERRQQRETADIFSRENGEEEAWPGLWGQADEEEEEEEVA